MGWWDRLFSPQRAPAPDRAAAVVPPGHQVNVIRASLGPSLSRGEGGLLIACSGLGGDDQEVEFERLFDDVSAELESPRAPVLMAATGTLTDLFAPSNPEVSPFSGGVVWMLCAGATLDLVADAPRLQHLLGRFRRIRRDAGPSSAHYVVLDHEPLPSELLVARLLRGSGFLLSRRQKDGAALVEVRRPDGIVLSALTGAPLRDADARVDAPLEALHRELDEVEAAGDTRRIAEVLARELGYLAHHTVRSEAPPVARAPKMRRLLLAILDNDREEARQGLREELLRRRAPLLFFVRPDHGAILRSWPGLENAVAAFSDRGSFEQAARELGFAPGSVGMASMPAKKLLSFAAERGFSLALNVYRDERTPQYVALRPAEIAALVARAAEHR